MEVAFITDCMSTGEFSSALYPTDAPRPAMKEEKMIRLKMHWQLFQGTDGSKRLCIQWVAAQAAILPGSAPKSTIH